MMADVIYLIGESPETHGVYDKPETKERMVYVTVRSVGMRERYESMAHDRAPEYVFELADYAEYSNEKACRYNGEIYSIIRTYIKGNKMELTAERSKPHDV